MNDNKPKASEEQLVYADLLSNGAWTGIGILVVTFIIYVSGLLPNIVEFDKLQTLWKLRAAEYIHETGAPTGWGWTSLLNNGDMLNFIGVAVLAGMTIVCYLRVVPIFVRKKDTVYLVITFLELFVLLLAASGILTAGGH
ncbi:MAG: hypothetical protein C4526_10250 [Nitrospiraceae bacterium]|nr:MAG: hypothetical protein C4526_10250 [Nitrospiraceae bacterium]